MEHIILKLDVEYHQDDRGSVVFPVQELGISPSEIQNIHCATIEPGATRGNHLHPDHDEYIFLIGKGLELLAKNNNGSGNALRVDSDPVAIKIYAGVSHAIINHGTSTGFLACWHMGETEEVNTERVNVLE